MTDFAFPGATQSSAIPEPAAALADSAPANPLRRPAEHHGEAAGNHDPEQANS